MRLRKPCPRRPLDVFPLRSQLGRRGHQGRCARRDAVAQRILDRLAGRGGVITRHHQISGTHRALGYRDRRQAGSPSPASGAPHSASEDDHDFREAAIVQLALPPPFFTSLAIARPSRSATSRRLGLISHARALIACGQRRSGIDRQLHARLAAAFRDALQDRAGSQPGGRLPLTTI